ncbi:MAG: glucokinase [Micavibrio aeruginosavorus]|uniref:Glucokinase n=1 Tax=Micavibrio aeruginosavorus TaxID=349221 RepID=A0A2W5Q6E1_9BACT|nr:MAG: glucokinase [Micavibrio aeruginosavorus]
MATSSLIADIGGTNARFALADAEGIYEQKTLQCADYPSIVDAAKAYLDGLNGGAPKKAAFAIAGPVSGDYFEMTNHLWNFSIKETQNSLGLDQFTLMNDFKAIALGVPHLKKADLRQVGGDQIADPTGAIGVIGPGTGLGVASLVYAAGQYHPVAGEGGHVTMAARTQREFDLIRTLRYKYHHISAERVCSGKGLVNLYNAIRRLDGHEELPDRTAEQISECAISKSCPVCEEALDKMMGFLGNVAGNLAVTLGATGGIYIAGGIPAKLGQYFFDCRFRTDFEAKGRYESYLKPIPTFLITHPNIAFVGLQSAVSNGTA